MEKLQQQLGRLKEQPLVAGLVTVVIAVVIINFLATKVQTVWFTHNAPYVAKQTISYQGPPATQIASMHLFGSSAADLKDLPLASLGLQVQGIFLNTQSQQSRALISMTGQEPKMYNIGDTLPGSVKIYKITADAVIVQHNGQLEKLPFALQGIDFNNTNQQGGLFS